MLSLCLLTLKFWLINSNAKILTSHNAAHSDKTFRLGIHGVILVILTGTIRVKPNSKNMSNTNLSDLEIEILLLGKWRINTSSEKINIQFKDDMTYEQTRIQILLFSKIQEFFTGNKFQGVWFVKDEKLHLNIKTIPESVLNFQIPLGVNVPLGDLIAALISLFGGETLDVLQIDNSKIKLKYKEEIILGVKIPEKRVV